jgi:hypothetical protein
MKNYSTLVISALISLCTLSKAVDNSLQVIDVVNNSNQSLQLNARNEDQTLKIDHNVPAFTKSLITVQMVRIKSLQDMLYSAILNGSIEGIQFAVQSGADVNRAIDGKSPLLWAILLEKSNVAKCLVQYGAAL